jgi:hypothetical protein
MLRGSKLATLLPTVLALVTLSACGGMQADSDHATASSVAHVHVNLGSPEYLFLVGSTTHTPQELFLYTATQTLIQRCMTAHGLRYFPSALAVSASPPLTAYTLTGTGLPPQEATVVAYDQVNGLDLSSPEFSASGPSTAPKNDQYVTGLAPPVREAYLKVLLGTTNETQAVPLPRGNSYTEPTGHGGCHGEALAKVYGSQTTYNNVTYVPQTIRLSVISTAEANPRVLSTTSAWQTCMTHATHQVFSKPGDIRRAVLARRADHNGSAQLRSEEVTLAVSDTMCAYHSGLADAYASAVRSGFESLTPSEYGALVATYLAEQHAITRATRLLDRPPAESR